MNPKERLDPHLLETLSAYLDGRLKGAEGAALEERLKKEENLRAHLEELRSVRNSLRSLPLRKPPRPLMLTPALVGTPAVKLRSFSPRWMALGSALASLAFVCVLSLDIFSHGAFPSAATAPRVLSVNEAVVAPPQSLDSSGAGKAAVTEQVPPPAAANATSSGMIPSPTEAPLAAGCGDCAQPETPTMEPSPTITTNRPGCGCHPTGTPTTSPVPATAIPTGEGFQPIARMDFQTAAPFLEAFFGLGAVLLAVLAVFFRRRR